MDHECISDLTVRAIEINTEILILRQAWSTSFNEHPEDRHRRWILLTAVCSLNAQAVTIRGSLEQLRGTNAPVEIR